MYMWGKAQATWDWNCAKLCSVLPEILKLHAQSDTKLFLPVFAFFLISRPWDVSTTDDVEQTKLILHMWVALFYRRQISSSTTRRVVEHSNPAKFVSLKRVVDTLEPLDDHGGSFSLEQCPANSVSEVDQGFNTVEETECPPPEKPLSCNELSSTNCIESEPPVLCVEKSSDPPLKDDQVDTTTSHSEAIHSFDKVRFKGT